ncbi:MAG: FAD-dependent oxidoreductase [Solirubrobacteraceae bacterium]|nr:FAD-dependent oxidoreductase [Solirubrobacteraceae bacterium]
MRTQTLRVLIAGGGVAALEAALALQELAPGRVDITLLSRSADYVVRPMTVQEPFSYALARRYPIDRLLGDGVTHIADDLDFVDTAARTVATRGGKTLPYDALLVATGARPAVRYAHAITMDDRKLDQLLHGMIQDIEGDYIRRVAFIAPERTGWPLPLYELALLTARRAWSMGIDLQTIVVTPEDRPLELFGPAASQGVLNLLRGADIDVYTSAHAEVPQRREIVINPGERHLQVDRVIALPELFGPAIVGLPQDSLGFIPVDECGKVDAGPVFAAGDATNFPIKHGGIAAQMALCSARSIAALAGEPIVHEPLDPILRGILLTGEAPRYLSARRHGGHSFDSTFTEEPTWDSPTKISSHYLSQRMAQLEGVPVTAR